MTKTIKICDKCGKEVNWLYKFPLMHIKGLNLDVDNYIYHEMCEECAEEFVDMYNHYTDSQKEVSF